jgi:tetratricopeptide (TPR) repeat protein
MSAQDQAGLADELKSEDANTRLTAVRRVMELSATDPRSVAIGIPKWTGPLLDAKQFDEVERISLESINKRSFDSSVVAAAQRARVLALIAQGKFPQALKEAKSYYNVALLSDSGEAIELLAQILAKTNDPATAAQFRIDQIAAAESADHLPPTTNPSAINTDTPPTPDAGSNSSAAILASIKIDPEPYQTALAAMRKHPDRNTNQLGEGNLLLLMDQPAEARKCFEDACKKSSGQKLREAVEGIARSARAKTASVAAANDLITAIRESPDGAGAKLMPGKPVAALQSAAQNTQLAEVQMALAVPPLELERKQAEAEDAGAPIRIITGFECSTPITVKTISPTHFEVSIDTPFTDWFMFRVEGANGKLVRIDLTGKNVVMSKWTSINPVYSYATDLDNPNGYDSIDPPPGAEITAWNGPRLPSTDGQIWHYIPDVWQERPDALSFVARFDSDAYVAMRAPYTPGYNERYLGQLASNPLADVAQVGHSPLGRPLLIVTVGETNKLEPRKPTILVYAGEHADEHDTGWVAQGLIERLLDNTTSAKNLRDRFTFLILPIFDPDSAVVSRHEGAIGGFLMGRRTPESVAYADWFQKWIDSGNRLDLVLDLHNVQSAESTQVACAILEGNGERGIASLTLHNSIIANLKSAGVSVEPRPWMRGWSPDRLGGWLSMHFGPITLAYEFDSQDPGQHLAPNGLKAISQAFLAAVNAFFSQPESRPLMASIDEMRRQRSIRLAAIGGGQIGQMDAIQFEAQHVDRSNAANEFRFLNYEQPWGK